MKLKKLEDIKNLHYNTDYIKMEFSDKRKLYELGFYNSTNNNSLKEEPTIDVLELAAEILSAYYGKITSFYSWNCNITGYRIVFGNYISNYK